MEVYGLDLSLGVWAQHICVLGLELATFKDLYGFPGLIWGVVVATDVDALR